MQAVFLDWASVEHGDLDPACLHDLPVSWQFHANTHQAQLPAVLRDCEIVVSNKVVLDQQAIREAMKLQYIGIAATGTNNVDLAAAAQRGIAVSNVRGYATSSVVQHVFMLILNLLRRLPDYQRALSNGRWQQGPHFCFLDYTIEDLSGKTLGIIGYGELGRAVAQMAQQFGMQVLIAQRPDAEAQADRIALVDLLPEVDVLSLHCPLTDTTRGLIGEHELAMMKDSAILINTARGGLVDEPALLSALRNQQLAGAGIDVLEHEPPLENAALLTAKLPNLILTPHIAWASRQARQRLIDGVAQNIEAFLAGKPRNQVN